MHQGRFAPGGNMTQQGDPWGPSEYPQQSYRQNPPGQPWQGQQYDPWAGSQQQPPPAPAAPSGYQAPGPRDQRRNGGQGVPPQFLTDRPDDPRYRPQQSRQDPHYRQPGPSQFAQPPQQPPQLPSWPPQQFQAPQWQQPYAPPQYTPQRPQPRKSRKGLGFLGCGGLVALAILFAIVTSSSPSSSTPPSSSGQQPATSGQQAAPAAPAQQAAPAAPDTVTYVVTGSAADVTYGPAGSDYSGTVPMSKTADIPSSPPLYYAVSAQLQGSGTVSCKIMVDGQVISSSTASGGYNIADCEISQDPLSGQWGDTNS